MANTHIDKLKIVNYAYEVGSSGNISGVHTNGHYWDVPGVSGYIGIDPSTTNYGQQAVPIIEAMDIDWRPYKVNNVPIVTSYHLIHELEESAKTNAINTVNSNALWVAGDGTNSLVAKNSSSIVNGDYALAEGKSNYVDEDYSHAEGVCNASYNPGSHAEGILTKNIQLNPGADHIGIEDYEESTIDYVDYHGGELVDGSFFIGFGIHAANHVEGVGSQASMLGSHAEGLSTRAYCDGGHSEGGFTLALGRFSHAEGVTSIAEHFGSHAEGRNSIARGELSHAEGWKTETHNTREHASGFMNLSHGFSNPSSEFSPTNSNDPYYAAEGFASADSTLFSIGIGEIDSNHHWQRANGFEMMQNGYAYFLGVGNYDGKNVETAMPLHKAIVDKEMLSSQSYVTTNALSAQGYLKSHPAPGNGTQVTGTYTTLAHGSTYVIQNLELKKDSNGHITSFSYKYGTLPAETQLSLGTNNGGNKVINKLNVSNHQITASYIDVPIYVNSPNENNQNKGILIETDIPYNSENGTRLICHIVGNNYTSQNVIDTWIQTNHRTTTDGEPQNRYSSCLHNGKKLGDIHIFSYHDHKCFWFLKDNQYARYDVNVFNTQSPNRNRVTSISETTADFIDQNTIYNTNDIVNDHTILEDKTRYSIKDTDIANSTSYGVVKVGTGTTGSLVGMNSSGQLTYTVPALSMGNGTGGAGKAITQLTVSEHQITASYGTFLTTHPAPGNGAQVTGTPTILTHGSTLVIQNLELKKDSNGHITSFSYKYGTLPAETQLSLGTNQEGGKGKAIVELLVNGHDIRAAYGTFLTEHPKPGTETQVTGTSTTLTHGSTYVIQNLELKKDINGHITSFSYKYGTLPSETQLSGGKAATAGKYVSAVTVSGHAVTVTQENIPVTSYYDVLTKGDYTSGLKVGTGFRMSGSASSVTYNTYSYSNIYVPYASNATYGVSKPPYVLYTNASIDPTKKVIIQTNVPKDKIGTMHITGSAFAGTADTGVRIPVDTIVEFWNTSGGVLRSKAVHNGIELPNIVLAYYDSGVCLTFDKPERYFLVEALCNASSMGVQNAVTEIKYGVPEDALYYGYTYLNNAYSVTTDNMPTLSMGSGTGGAGKAITSLSVNGHTITASYGSFLTAHQTIPVTSYYDVLTNGIYSTGLQVGRGYRMSGGTVSNVTYAAYAYSNIYVPYATKTTYGVSKAYYVSTTLTDNDLTSSNGAVLFRGVSITKNGYLYTPLEKASNSAYGLIKTKQSNASSLTASDIVASSTSQRYAVNLASDGIAYVGVPLLKYTDVIYTNSVSAPRGFIIETDIPQTGESGSRLILHIVGNTYDKRQIADTWVQTNHRPDTQALDTENSGGARFSSCIHNGFDLGDIYIFVLNGHRCFWFKQVDQYAKYYVSVVRAESPNINRVISVTQTAASYMTGYMSSYSNALANNIAYISDVSRCEPVPSSSTYVSLSTKNISNGAGLVGMNSSGQLTYTNSDTITNVQIGTTANSGSQYVSGLTISKSGITYTISASYTNIPTASTSVLGAVKVGSGISGSSVGITSDGVLTYSVLKSNHYAPTSASDNITGRSVFVTSSSSIVSNMTVDLKGHIISYERAQISSLVNNGTMKIQCGDDAFDTPFSANASSDVEPAFGFTEGDGIDIKINTTANRFPMVEISTEQKVGYLSNLSGTGGVGPVYNIQVCTTPGTDSHVLYIVL